MANDLLPVGDGNGNLGSSILRWVQGFFSTGISDGNNSASVADIKDAVDKKHVAVTTSEGSGVSVTGQSITNTDKGSTSLSSHTSAYDHTKIHDRQHAITSGTDHTGVSTDGTMASASDEKIPTEKAVKTYADGLVVGLLDDRGSYDASGNVFPSTGGSGPAGAVLKGDLWYISVGGTLGGITVTVGSSVRALVDTPGQTAGNWDTLDVGLGYVPENVVNKSTDATMGGAEPSDTLYPSQKATSTALAGKSGTDHTHAQLHDAATATVNGGLSVTGQAVSLLGSNLATKETPIDADGIFTGDSAATWVGKIVTWTNAWANYFKAKADALYATIAHTHATMTIAPATNTDTYVPRWNGTNSKTLSDGVGIGTSANQLVQLNGDAKLPAVDGSLLTNLPASKWNSISTLVTTATQTYQFEAVGDLTATILPGDWLKYKLSGTYYYGFVSAIAFGDPNTQITVAGVALTTGAGDLAEAYYAKPTFPPIQLFVEGYYAAAVEADLLRDVAKCPIKWMSSDAYLVALSGSGEIVDTGTEGKFNAEINGAALLTADTNKGIQLGAANTWVNNFSATDAGGINASNYKISFGQELELSLTEAGGTGDARNLTAILVVVTP